ncbi:hypothetical protein GIB67_009191 [Kingdonia uniflora]|uniref:ribonuclease Z n=1 Tax=Kingdonia uniflora TaxID=39325 RepID=A0A7J7N2M1_9MAGN|nr:hypothetical protein GIB67_009191 [Kingdonia uniflora]
MDTQDTSPSVLIFFDNQRFIFNVGEICHIFLYRVYSKTVGGLPDLLLTLAGMGDERMSVKIWGPSDLKYLVDAMRMFIPNAAMIHTHSFGPAPNADEGTLALVNFTNPIILIDDEVAKISAILLRPSGSGSIHLDPASINLKPGDISVIYICELSKIKAKFDPAKAKALGLNPGTNYRELQLGNSVMSDHQNIMVHPTDVLGPSIPGPIILLIDCPTLSHLKDMEIPILKASARVTARLNYLCPQFFPAPGFWSLPNFNNFTPESISSTEGSFSKLNQSISVENLLKFHLRPYAQLGVDKSGIPSLSTPTEIVDELLSEIPEIVDSLHQVNQLWHEKSETNNADKRESIVMIEEPWLNENTMNLVEQSTGASIDGTSYLDSEAGLPTCLENVTREDMEIVLLGTGSSQPSKYQNISSIYINLFSKGSLLLDCGEGMLGQLKRRFGVKGADISTYNYRKGQAATKLEVFPGSEFLVTYEEAVKYGGKVILAKGSRKTYYGRAPSVLVLLPTRELPKQVYAEFEVYGGSLNLTGCCLYGRAPYYSQETSLKRGVDIVIGTPGRIKDHIKRGNFNFSSLKFRVLDEADEILKMEFVDDVELILGISHGTFRGKVCS